MKVGIIGPPDSVSVVIHHSEEFEFPIECFAIPFTSYHNVKQLVNEAQEKMDGLLFTGTTPFSFAAHNVNQTKPWEYLPRNTQSLMCALLKAVYKNGCDIKKISYDSYSYQTIVDTLKEIEIDSNEMVILESSFNHLDSNYEENLFQFHSSSYKLGKVSICLTGMSRVEERLKKCNIPVCRPFATSEVITQQLQKLYLAHTISKTNENNEEIAVLSIDVSFNVENSIAGKNELYAFLLSAKVSEKVYYFSQNLNGALETYGNNQYRIYLKRRKLDNEMIESAKFSLLKDIMICEGVSFVSIGIGYGINFKHAKYRSKIAQQHALQKKTSCLFIMQSNDFILGPIVVSSSDEEVKKPLDRGMQQISKETNIKTETLLHIRNMLKLYGIDTISSIKLAQICNMSINSTNRILVKLEKAGYLAVVGKESSLSKGRPHRILRLLLPNK